MWREVVAFLREPRPRVWSRPPRGDGALALALVGAAAVEVVLRDDLRQPALALTITAALAATIALRRAQPLAAVALAYSPLILLRLGPGGPAAVGLTTTACVLLLPYSLLRWGSGREAAVGLLFLAGAYGAAAARGEMHDAGEVVGGALVLLFPAALGASSRFRAEAHRRALEHATLRERATLARDLHDTVAHHVSAIAVQAQAAQAVLAVRPDAAARALQAIEREAAATMAELRAMVGALRDDTEERAAPPGVADLHRLAAVFPSLAVEVDLAPTLTALPPPVQTTLYRVAQEALTNVVRHARGATRVVLRVSTNAEQVHLLVEDDGVLPSRARELPAAARGFGLRGMSERAALHGGTLEAGPGGAGGWRVEMSLPSTRDDRARRVRETTE